METTVIDAIAARLVGFLGGDRVRKLHRSRVAVIGAGLLGGQLLLHLAMLQIRTVVVDPGLVEAANLGNQLFPVASLGVNDFGQSGDIQDLYRHFGIDTDTIVGAAFDVIEA